MLWSGVIPNTAQSNTASRRYFTSGLSVFRQFGDVQRVEAFRVFAFSGASA
jgi:hypothetical protein